jgi:putative PIN family toxin of toxin-antitoxin system
VPSPVPGVVFDCNIFVQALLKPNGPAGACKQVVDEGAVTLFVSPQVLTEVAEVLARPRIRQLAAALTLTRIEAFFENITAKAVSITNVPAEFLFERDPKDEPYVNLAIVAGANYLVSRDRDLLDLMTLEGAGHAFRQRYPTLTILDPVAFLQAFKR